MHFRTATGILILSLLTMLLASCDLQYRFLYYPDGFMPSREELAANGMRFWPSGPVGYRGFIGAGDGVNFKGTVIVFHGNAGTAADRAYYVSALGAIGYRVILAEYPRYGMRKGALGEESFVRDAQATVHLVSEQYGKPIFLLGESIGCGVAAAAVRDNTLEIAGIILITPWDTLLAVARMHFPWLPVRWFMKDKYDNVANLASYGGRIAVVGAEQDDIVPIRHAKQLFGLLTGVTRMWTIKGAGHNDWPALVDKAKWQEFMNFVSGVDDRRA